MNVFGEKDVFGIGYEIEDPKERTTYGSMYFWLNGKNLFQFKGWGEEATYTADLTTIVEIFCKYLICYLKDDPFPIETKSTNAIDMLEETLLIEGPDNDVTKYADVNWDNVDMEERDAREQWSNDHGIITHNDGSLLPVLFIRNVNDQIEISWHNQFPYNVSQGKLYFEYIKGVEYIDIRIFKKVIVDFCLHLINIYQDQYPDVAKRDRANLQKAIDFEV